MKGRKLMQFRNIGWFRPLLALCALLLFSCAGMQAQLTTADFGGAVTDSTGAVIPHAQITLIETGTHTVHKAQSNDDGAYAFNQIQPGLYNLKIEAKGFTSFAVSGIQVSAGAHPRVDARLDIGQGCVVRKGTVLAVEAFEGTDEMLRRAGGFKTDEALFVKTVKSRQDYRFDVPCFGLRTLEVMRESHLHAAALEARGVILLDKPAVLAQARDWGISLLGFG